MMENNTENSTLTATAEETTPQMEYLGYTFETPKKLKSGKWRHVELVFDNDETFNKCTGKIIKSMYQPNSDNFCTVMDASSDNSQHYKLEIIHVTYDTYTNSIKLFPINCDKILLN